MCTSFSLLLMLLYCSTYSIGKVSTFFCVHFRIIYAIYLTQIFINRFFRLFFVVQGFFNLKFTVLVIIVIIIIVIMCISGAKGIVCTKYYFYKMCTAERLEPTGQRTAVFSSCELRFSYRHCANYLALVFMRWRQSAQ